MTIPFDIDTRHNNWGSATMISYGNVIIIWLQCILGTTVHCTDTESVIATSVKVRIITNEHWKMHGYILLSMKCRLAKTLVIPQNSWIGGILRQQIDDRWTHSRDSLTSRCGKCIQCRLLSVQDIEVNITCRRVDSSKPEILLNAPSLARTLKSSTNSPMAVAGLGVESLRDEKIPNGIFLMEKWLPLGTEMYDIVLE